MHRGDAVVDLARRPAILPPDPRRLGPFLGATGLVDQPDRVPVGMIATHDPVQPLPQPIVVPVQQRQELLQRPRRHLGGQSDRFDALAGQVGQLASDVHRQVLAGVGPAETVGEFVEVGVELRL